MENYFFGGRFVLHEISLRLKSGEHFVLRIIDAPTASITITDASGVNVYSGTSINPTLITIELNATEPGEYYLEIELGEARLSGYFTL